MTREQAAQARNNRFFGGNRSKALQRDKYKCVKCGMTNEEHKSKWGRELAVDHIDGRGTNSPKHLKNNSLDNLQTMCYPCHTRKDVKRIVNTVGRKPMPNRYEITCVQCSKTIMAIRPYKKYCSPTCSSTYQKWHSETVYKKHLESQKRYRDKKKSEKLTASH